MEGLDTLGEEEVITTTVVTGEKTGVTVIMVVVVLVGRAPDWTSPPFIYSSSVSLLGSEGEVIGKLVEGAGVEE